MFISQRFAPAIKKIGLSLSSASELLGPFLLSDLESSVILLWAVAAHFTADMNRALDSRRQINSAHNTETVLCLLHSEVELISMNMSGNPRITDETSLPVWTGRETLTWIRLMRALQREFEPEAEEPIIILIVLNATLMADCSTRTMMTYSLPLQNRQLEVVLVARLAHLTRVSRGRRPGQV